jgi:glucokinase
MFLLFDIGGTQTRIALAHRDEIIEESDYQTIQSYPEALAMLVREARSMAGSNAITAAVIGVPGPLNADKTMLLNAPNLSEWVGQSLHDDLSDGLKVPVHIENDAALAGLGEAVYGAGSGYRVVAYLTISTGVGGVRIVDKKIDVNIMGFEPGHQYIDLDKSVYPQAPYGTLEKYVSGEAIQARTGIPAHEITDQDIWRATETTLAFGIHNTIVHWSPEVVVLGGGLVRSEAVSITTIANHLQEIMYIFPEIPPLKKADLDDNSGLMGALALAKNIL